MSPGAVVSFYNLPSADLSHRKDSFFPSPSAHEIKTNWKTFADQPLSRSSLLETFANCAPVIREKNFLTPEECSRMVEIIKTHELGEYDPENMWPRVGTAGITQYDHINNKDKYFNRRDDALSLQKRWKSEAGIDVVQRVMDRLHKVSGLPVRLAREGDREYFAGLMRAVDHGIDIHADYAPYEAPGWSIDGLAAQLTWNILLGKVPGGDTIIYDRQWQAPEDDVKWRKSHRKDTYCPQMLQGHSFKAMEAEQGDLTFFNPRNYHEVKGCDTSYKNPEPTTRLTISSFVGFMPANGSEPDTLVMWS